MYGNGNGNGTGIKIDWSASYINDEWLKLAGIYRVDHPTGAEAVGRKPSGMARYDGVIIPNVWPGDNYTRMSRLRRDKPDFEKQPDGTIKERGKYLSPPGRGNLIYFPPRTNPEDLQDADVPALIVEGEKKAIAMMRFFFENGMPFLVVGLAGVWSWRGRVETLRDVNGHAWAEIKGTVQDFERIKWRGRAVTILFDTNAVTNASVSAARAALARELRARDAAEVVIRNLPIDQGLNGPDDFLGKYGPDWMHEFLSQPIERRPQAAVETEAHFTPSNTLLRPKELTVMGLAARFHERYFLTTRYVESRGVFFSYENGVWIESRCAAEGKTKVIINELHDEAAAAQEEYEALQKKQASGDNTVLERMGNLGPYIEAVSKFLKVVKKPSTMSGILDFAKSDLLIGADDFDPNPTLFNASNGAIDLETGEFREHRSTDLCSLQSPVRYVKGATAPRWEKFLQEIFLGDQDLIAFIQRAAGYSLSGYTSEQQMLILHGGGSNGKGTFFRMMELLLGTYGRSPNIDTFMDDKPAGGHNEDIARLRGCRMVMTSETEKSKRLAEALVKRLTGEDTMTASFKHERSFQFRPRFKIWMAANYKPVINGTDDGIWRRILLVPFFAAFHKPKDWDRVDGIRNFKIDPTLEPALQQEISGILNWAIEGYGLWRKHGLYPPKAVNDASADYRSQSDKLGAFLDEECEKETGTLTPLTDIYDRYKKWAEASGVRATSKHTFASDLRMRGVEVRKTGKANTTCIEGYVLIARYGN